MNSCLYHGVLRHQRLQPTTHRFSYRVFMAWIDLDELAQLPSVGVRRNRFAAAAFHDADYPLGTPLKDNALNQLAALTGERPEGRVMLRRSCVISVFILTRSIFTTVMTARTSCAGCWRRFAIRPGMSAITTP